VTIQDLLIGLIEGIGVSAIFVLALMAGVCVFITIPKLRAAGRKSLVIRNLGDRAGVPVKYLAPDAPRGQVDQLRPTVP
jgi:hypothetical protein